MTSSILCALRLDIKKEMLNAAIFFIKRNFYELVLGRGGSGSWLGLGGQLCGDPVYILSFSAVNPVDSLSLLW